MKHLCKSKQFRNRSIFTKTIDNRISWTYKYFHFSPILWFYQPSLNCSISAWSWPIEMLHPILKTWEKGNQCRWWLKMSKLSWRFKKIPEVFCFTHYFCLTARNPKFILAPSKSYRSGQNLPTEMFHPILKSLDQAESNSTWAGVLRTSLVPSI